MTRHVLLIQLDGRLPNLALMRISAWHRSLGDVIHFARSPYRQLDYPVFDAVYGSAIFKFSADQVSRFRAEWPNAFVGGTGTDSKLTVEDIPGFTDQGVDYEFYPEFSASIGFTQRGCRLSCKFCVVPGKEGRPVSVATVADIWRGTGKNYPHPKHLHLLDNDFFGQSEDQWRARIEEVREGGFKVSFTQGINVRAMTEDVAAALATIEYRDDAFSRRRLYTAWDNLKDEDVFFRGVDLLRRHGIPPSHLMVFMLVGFDKRETWDRIFHRFNRMVDLGIRPYPMVFDHTRRDLKRFQRWVVTGLYRAVPFDQYDPSRKAARPNDDTGQTSAF
ncbi:MAG: radical SAM protein [Mesorhizobium sp.]|nr:MAG: radical SAM protein [Mesorhizobium sp.]RWQ38738.1 MAG: radical SAM protein [Mesorhizobium sp.]